MAALVFEFSFVLDCADGQLARLRKIASPVGHLLDFLMDELKAMLLFACVAVRLWQDTGDERLLVVGLFALFCLASGLSLTSFMRRPEYGAKPPTEDGQPAEVGGRTRPDRRSCSRRSSGRRGSSSTIRSTSGLSRSSNRIDIYFWAYAGVNVLYLGKSLAAILLAPRSVRTATDGATRS